ETRVVGAGGGGGEVIRAVVGGGGVRGVSACGSGGSRGEGEGWTARGGLLICPARGLRGEPRNLASRSHERERKVKGRPARVGLLICPARLRTPSSRNLSAPARTPSPASPATP